MATDDTGHPVGFAPSASDVGSEGDSDTLHHEVRISLSDRHVSHILVCSVLVQELLVDLSREAEQLRCQTSAIIAAQRINYAYLA